MGQQGGREAFRVSGDAGTTTSVDRLDLFGAPRLWHAGTERAEPLDWHKPVALLAYLCCRPSWHSRQSLSETLRPEASHQAGRAYVRGLLHRTREFFPRITSLDVEDGRVRWRGSSDVQEFEQAMARGDWSTAIELQQAGLLESVGSTGEPLLDDWFREERTRLRQRLGSALVACVVSQERADAPGRAELMQKLVELDPMDESAVQVILQHARSAFERHTAAAAYQTLRRRLESELGQEPLESTNELYLKLQQQGRQPPTPATSEARRPSPAQVPGVPAAPLGREREWQELTALLATPSVRVITMHGQAGVGKTSLAQALFAACEACGESPVWADLQGIDTAHGMLAAIAVHGSMPLHDGPLEEQLARWLAGRELVVFLDNFEQLTASAHVLERLLRAAPALRLVVTSREALGLPGERLYAVGGLDFHGPDSPAACLFALNAARLGHPVAAVEQAHVCALVEYLEGLPLAIELAANWATLLPADAVLAELRRNPSIIDAAKPDGGTRSMQSVFEGMWNRLDGKEQEALLSLSLMMGQIDLQTVGARAYGEAGVFLRLVRKSLLQRTEGGLFRMHPLLRAFVQERSGAQALQEARSRYADRIFESFVRMPAMRVGRFLPDLVSRIQPYTDDLAQAWRFAVDDGRWDLVDAALPNLSGFLMMVSRHELLIELVIEAERRAPAGLSIRADLAVSHALASFRLGRMDQAESIVLAALEHGPVSSTSRALLQALVSCVRRFHGDQQQALRYAQEALKSLGDEGDPFARLQIVEALALCHWHLGHMDEAEFWLLRNLALARRGDARYAEANSLCLLGIVRNAMGRPKDALELLHSSEKLFQQMHDPYKMAYCERGMSYVYLTLGDLRRQQVMAEGALARFREAGYEHEIAESLFAVVVAHDAAGRAQEARHACNEALRSSLRLGQVPIALRCIGALGAFEAPGDRRAGFALMSFAAAHPALRRTDRLFFERRFEALGATDLDLAQARERAASLTFESVCEFLMGQAGAGAIALP